MPDETPGIAGPATPQALDKPVRSNTPRGPAVTSVSGPPANIWRWTVKDKHGNPVPAAEGAPAFTSRGPTSVQEMRKAAQQLLNSRMQDLWMQAGGPPDWDNPGWVVDEITPVGHTEQTDANLGVWRPPGAVPLQPIVATDENIARAAAGNAGQDVPPVPQG